MRSSGFTTVSGCSSIPTRVRNLMNSEKFVEKVWFQHTYEGSKLWKNSSSIVIHSRSSIPTRVRNDVGQYRFALNIKVPAYLRGFETSTHGDSHTSRREFQHTYEGSKPLGGRKKRIVLNSSSIPTRVRNLDVQCEAILSHVVPAYLRGFETLRYHEWKLFFTRFQHTYEGSKP